MTTWLSHLRIATPKLLVRAIIVVAVLAAAVGTHPAAAQVGGPPPFNYFPSGSEIDGRMISQAGTNLQTLVDVGTDFSIIVDGTGRWELGIFDGDTGKDESG